MACAKEKGEPLLKSDSGVSVYMVVPYMAFNGICAAASCVIKVNNICTRASRTNYKPHLSCHQCWIPNVTRPLAELSDSGRTVRQMFTFNTFDL